MLDNHFHHGGGEARLVEEERGVSDACAETLPYISYRGHAHTAVSQIVLSGTSWLVSSRTIHWIVRKKERGGERHRSNAQVAEVADRGRSIFNVWINFKISIGKKEREREG